MDVPVLFVADIIDLARGLATGIADNETIGVIDALQGVAGARAAHLLQLRLPPGPPLGAPLGTGPGAGETLLAALLPPLLALALALAALAMSFRTLRLPVRLLPGSTRLRGLV